MLKPKKKLTRKEIKKDPMLEFLYDAQQWIQTRQKLLTQVGTGVVVVIVVGLLLLHQRHNTTDLTSTQMGQALISLQQNDVDNAEYTLQILSDEHGSTPEGLHAAFFMGKLKYENGDTNSAVQYLSKYLKSGDNEIMLTNAAVMLSDLYQTLGQNNDAIRVLKKTGKKVKLAENKDRLLLVLAKYYAGLEGNKSKVEGLLKPIINNSDTPLDVKREAEEVMGSVLT